MRLNQTILTGLSVFFVLGVGSGSVLGQFETELVNGEGATAPCVGIGPIGGPAAKKCAEMFIEAGFLREGEVGVSGLTVGRTGDGDGVISAVAGGSAAEQAGLAAGDSVLAVDGVAVRRTQGRSRRSGRLDRGAKSCV